MTTKLAGHGPLDATLGDVGFALSWKAVHRTQPRAYLTCTDLRSTHARQEAWSARPAGLKRELAQAVHIGDHHAELEVAAAHRGWWADVLATAPEGRGTAA
ncbi:hypothetical protein PV721_26675 [Streptomyces sp. MB09-01]|uniref:hypothetical protein n=1 Tax=Streptomyces sp. MB09-01 TaxID=3028666 RepID=UPI0029A71826|nr:hypothetical protein [Streptomyces sp. MB09-01]MDX3537878.1 hypothetical protein [Streptomyces sp. MB09-01]